MGWGTEGQPLGKTVWQPLMKLNLLFQSDAVITLLGIFPKGVENVCPHETCPWMRDQLDPELPNLVSNQDVLQQACGMLLSAKRTRAIKP